MKRVISILLCMALLLSVMVFPAHAATGAETTLKKSLGRYYCFSFEDGNNRYDYNAVYNKPVTYKGGQFYPFWCYTDKTVAAEANYTKLDNGTDDGLDVLQLKAPGTVYFTPLSADGAPFEVEPGKTYAVKLTAYIEVEVSWSHCYMAFCTGRDRINESSEYYTNNNRAYVKGTAGASTAAASKATAASIANRPVAQNGYTKNNGSNWAQGVKGTSTSTASKVTATTYFTIPADGENGVKATYDATNDAFSFQFPKYEGSSMSTPFDADKDGNQDYTDSTNYFSFMFNGTNFTDDEGTVWPFTYDIASLEIWEDGYTPDLEFVVGDTTVKTVNGDQRDNPGWFVPETPEGTYFTGWYSNAACTKIVNTDEALNPSVTKVYAGFKPYEAGITVDFSRANTDSKVYYPTYLADKTPQFSSMTSRVGWSFRKIADGTCQLTAGAAWAQGGSYLLSDALGNAFVAKPNTTYTITMEYKIDLVDPEAVGQLPDGSTYGTPFVQFNVGIGMPQSYRGTLQDKQFSFAPALEKVTENVGWTTKTYIVTTGDMTNIMPVVGIYAYCSGLPYRYSGTSKADGNTGDSTWGFNCLSVRSITVTSQTNLTFMDQNGNQLTRFAQNFGENVNFAQAEAAPDVIYPDGTGYSVSSYTWYEDADMTKKINVADAKVPAADVTYYAQVETVFDNTGNQVSYYGFDDLWEKADKDKISGYSLVTGGYHSAQSIKTTASNVAAVDVTPNAALNDTVGYVASFWYKATKQATIILGGTEKTLPAADDWTVVTLPVRSENGRVKLTVTANSGTLCFDDFGVYQPLYKGGASVLTDAAATVAGGQALRVYYAYYDQNGTLNTGAGDQAVTERGILLLRSSAVNDQPLTLATKGVTVVKKTTGLDTCWDYQDGLLTYSTCVNAMKKNDTRALTVRGYVVLADGNTYYSEETVYTVADVKEMLALAEQKNTYSFAEKEVLDKVVLDARYVQTAQGVTYDWTGATLRMNVKSMGELALRMLVEPTNIDNDTYLTVYIDGQRVNRRFVVPVDTLEEKEYTFRLFVGGDNKTHTVEIARQNEAGMAKMILCDVTINGTLEQATEKKLLVEFIGDSITCGQGDLTTVARDPAGAPYSDGTSAYAFLAARELDVDYRMVSGSGRGVIYSSGGTTGVGASWLATYGIQNDRRSKTDAYVSNRAADVVCIYLGTNDCYGRSINANVKFTDQELVDKMGELITLVRSYNPGAKIVWISGGITRSYEEFAEAAIANAGGSANGCYMFKFSKSGLQSGGAWHPTFDDQAFMGQELAAYLRDNGIVDTSLF